MPVRNAELESTTLAAHKQISFEGLLAAWLLSDGWECIAYFGVRPLSATIFNEYNRP